MGVKMRGNAAHVLIQPRFDSEAVHDNRAQSSQQYDPNFLWGVRVVSFPHHHRDEARLALGDPALVVLVVALGERRGLAQLAAGVSIRIVAVGHSCIMTRNEGPEGPSFQLGGDSSEAPCGAELTDPRCRGPGAG